MLKRQVITLNNLLKHQIRSYHPARELMKKRTAKFYSDPQEIGAEIVKMVSLHDKIKDPSQVTIGSSFEELGLDSFDFVDVLMEIEHEYKYDFGASDWEQFITINDIAQFMARDYFAQKH
jgi:acyl carrier protein